MTCTTFETEFVKLDDFLAEVAAFYAKMNAKYFQK
jgi:hypothetical protein